MSIFEQKEEPLNKIYRILNSTHICVVAPQPSLQRQPASGSDVRLFKQNRRTGVNTHNEIRQPVAALPTDNHDKWPARLVM